MKQLDRQQRHRRPESRKSVSRSLDRTERKARYYYVVEIDGFDGRTDHRSFENLKPAENRYYRAFAAVKQEMSVLDDSGRRVRLVRCRIFHVEGNGLQRAIEQIANNRARRLLDSDDLLGDGVKIDGLFRVLH